MVRIKYMLICSLMVLLAACEKDTEPTNFAPGLTTGNVTDIYRKGATLSGSIHFSSASTVQSYGILFSELQSMAECTEHPVKDGSHDFSINMQNLTPNTTYYYCAYASSGFSLAKGDVKSFTTTESNAPVFEELTLKEKDAQSCTVSVAMIDEGGSELILTGFCWTKDEEGEPTTDDNVRNVSMEGNVMIATITGLQPETVYQVRAYGVNSSGIGYSQVCTFTTDERTEPGIYSLEDLNAFRDARNAGADVSLWKNAMGIINVFADIDMSSVPDWEPIASIASDEVLQGNGHTLKGLAYTEHYDTEKCEDWGFVLNNAGTIQDMNLDVVLNVGAGKSNVLDRYGAIAYNNGVAGKIVNCLVTINSSFWGYTGGVVCYNNGLIEQCTVKGEIKSTTEGCGICVWNEGIIKGCTNYSNVTNETGSSSGIVGVQKKNMGQGEAQIVDCVNMGNIVSNTSFSHQSVGGIIASLYYGSVTGCTNQGLEKGEIAGGIVGIIQEEFDGTYSDNKNIGIVNDKLGDDINAIGKDLRIKYVSEVAYLINGSTFNKYVKQFANNNDTIAGHPDYLIKKVEFQTEIKTHYAENYINVAADNSQTPIYASFNETDGLLTVYTASKNIEVVDAGHMFYNMRSLETIDFGNFQVNETTTDMRFMFGVCQSLTSLDISHWNTSNVTNMRDLFDNCYVIESLDISDWNTSNVTDMSWMFQACEVLSSLDLSKWDTSNVTNMSRMFSGCDALISLDLSKWNTSQVTDMSYMFMASEALSSLNVSTWNTSNVVDMQYMFYCCYSLTSMDFSKWDTSKVTNMSGIFTSCKALTSLNLSGWNTSKVTDMSQLFYNCYQLTELNIANWSLKKDVECAKMFLSCSSTSKACEITSSLETKDFLLGVVDTTNMISSYFKWMTGE